MSGRRAPDATLPDAELIGLILDGNRDQYQVLVQRHQESLYRVAYSLVSDDDAAADLVQDAFVRAYANLARCRDRTRFRVWLLATLRNRALDYLKEKRRSDLSLTDENVARRADEAAATGESEADRLALRTALEAALERLSEPLREAFVLRHVEQLSCEEAAEVLGTSVSAVKMRVLRAREQLREWLAPEHEDVTGRPTGSSNE